MSEILYDILIKGVIPLGIVALLGFLLKSYWRKYKGITSQHATGAYYTIAGLFIIGFLDLLLV